MSPELFVALLMFALAMLFTPGPNNVMLMASGVNFGLARTVPHLLGVGLGFGLMVVLVGLGLGGVLALYPVLYKILAVAGAVYLVYLAVRIAGAAPVALAARPRSEGTARPFTFLQAAAFQWINPKGWVAAVGANAAYAAVARFPLNIIVIAGVFTILGLASAVTWVLFGSALRPLLARPGAQRAFNLAMAALLVASIWPVVAELAR